MLFTRFDGQLARDLPAYRRMIPFLMRGRNESAVYFEQTVDLTQALPWLERFSVTHNHRCSLFHLVLGAMVRTLGERPRLNRFVSGRRIWDRKGIWLSFAAKQRMDEGAPLRTVKLRFSPGETFANLAVRIDDAVGQARSGRKSPVDRELGLLLRLPRFLLELAVRVARLLDFFNLAPRALFEHDPMYTSAFVANLGSLKLDAAYHHLFEHGNCPLFVTVGRIQREPVVADDGTVHARTVVRLKYVYDERVEDGLYCVKALDLLRQRVENPAGWAEDVAKIADSRQRARPSQARGGTDLGIRAAHTDGSSAFGARPSRLSRRVARFASGQGMFG